MTNNADQLDRGVTSLLDARSDAADSPLPWTAVMERATDPSVRSLVPEQPPAQRRWPLVAASLLLVFGAVAALSTIVDSDDPAVSELPPPSLDLVELDGVGPTRALSSISEGEVAVPTLLFSELMLEPVIVEDGFIGSTWFARDGAPEKLDTHIRVNTSELGESTRRPPDVELTVGGVEWGIESDGLADHSAFAEIGQVRVAVSVRGVEVSDLELVLAGLRAADPEAHPSSLYDPESDGVVVTRSPDGQYSLEATFVGDWLCSTSRSLRAVRSFSACVIPTPQDDGLMLINTVTVGLPVNGDSSDVDDPLDVTVYTAGFVPADSAGADIVHVDEEIVFAPAEDRSGDFDVLFFLDVHDLAETIGSDPVEIVGLEAVAASTVFDN